MTLSHKSLVLGLAAAFAASLVVHPAAEAGGINRSSSGVSGAARGGSFKAPSAGNLSKVARSPASSVTGNASKVLKPTLPSSPSRTTLPG